MEVRREKLRDLSPLDQPKSADELRVRQLRARDLLRGDLEGDDLQAYVEERLLTTTLDRAQKWARSNAMWPATFGLACCAIEMMAMVSARYDTARFGAEPKWVLAMGACSSSGGMFANYAVVQGADKFLPVDIHIPGCPPRTEALIYGILKLQRQIQGNPDMGWRKRYEAEGTEEWARDLPIETGATPPADRGS